MATFTGQLISATYDAILKTIDNDHIGSTAKQITDGLGNVTPLYVSTTQIGIGITPTEAFHVSGNVLITGNITVNTDATITGNISSTGSSISLSNATNPTITVTDTTNSHYLTLQSLDGASKIDYLSTLIFEYGASNTEAARLTSSGLTITEELTVSGTGQSSFAGQVTVPATPSASTDAASKGYVDSQVTAQDLDFSGDNGGTGSVDLDSQVFAINGTANQITTTQSGQSLTIAMPYNITIGGIVNATTFSGQLDGTISSTTTATTQSQGDNSTKLATTAYVDSAIGGQDTLAEILANGNTTGGTDIAVSSGDNITFADSSKSIYGAGSDLEIYHNGSHSYITNNTGNFEITSTGSLILQDANSLKWMMTNQGGSVLLYYNGVSKLTTTSTGVKINSTGAGAIATIEAGDANQASLDIKNTEGHYRLITDAGELKVYDQTDSRTPFLINTSGNVGIGLTSVGSRRLNVFSSDSGIDVGFESTIARTSGSNFGIRGLANGAGATHNIGAFFEASGATTNTGLWAYNGRVLLATQNTTDYVGIGTDSPDCKLDIRKSGTTAAQGDTDLLIGDSGAASTTAQVQILGGASGYSNLYFSDTSAYNVGGFIYNHSSNYLATNVNGSEKMRIDSSGNVGIGTASPNYNLEINGSSAEIGLNGSAVYRIRSTSNDEFIITKNGVGDRLFIAAGGNVGIGTTSPSAKFTIQGTNSANGGIKIQNSGGNPYAIYSDNNDLLFTNGNGSTTALGITYSGNIGVGTSTINGFGSDTVFAVYNASTPRIKLQNSTTGTANTDGAEFNMSGLDLIVENREAGNIRIFNNGSERMRISGGGNVGIGTTLPDSRLDVTGGDITVNTTGTGFMNFKYSGSQKGTIGTDGIDLKITANADLQLLPTGNVGIGTTSPDSKLNIEGVKNTSIITLGSTTNDSSWSSGDKIGGINFYSADGSGSGAGIKGSISYIATSSSGGSTAMIFNTASSSANNIERMRIDASGNVGIGIAPVSGARLTLGTGSVANEILSFASSTGGNAEFRNTSSTGTFTFTNANGSSEKMRINSSGNVGMGGTGIYTTVATLNLDGEGIAIKNDRDGSSNNWSYIRNTGTVSSSNIQFVTGQGNSLTLNHDKSATFSNDVQVNGQVGIGITNPLYDLHAVSTIGTRVLTLGHGAGYARISTDDASKPLDLQINSQNALRIATSKNIGIGTDNPENKLHILRSSSDTESQIMVQNGGSGDAAIKFNVSGQSYVVGIDQDDSSKFKIASSSNLGTNDRVTLLSSGNVGIGTITPATKLEIDQSANTYTSGLSLRNGNNVIYGLYVNGSNDLNFQYQGSDKVTFQSGGNVGIGTTSPSAKLQVLSGDEQLTNFGGSVTDRLAYSRIGSYASTSGTITGAAALELVGSANASGHGRHAWIGAEGTSNTNFLTKLKFKIRGETDNGYAWAGSSEAPTIMTLEGDGNVGIGVENPSDYYATANDLVVGGASTHHGITIATGTTSTGALHFADGTSGAAEYAGYLAYEHSTNRFRLGVNSSDKFVILSTGNTGIGTSTPTSKLEVKMNDNANNRLGFTGDGSTNGAAMWTNWQTGSSHLDFRLGGTTDTYTKMRITSSGNVGIDVSSPDSYNSSARKLVVGGSGDSGITISTSSTNMGTLMFADGTGGTAGYRGRVSYHHNGDYMRFDTAATARMYIDSLGNVAIGGTTTQSRFEVRDSKTGSFQSPHLTIYGSGYGSFQWLDTDAYHIYTNSDGRDIEVICYANGVRLEPSATAWVSNSDISLKENIKPLENVLDKIKDYRCVEYNFKDDKVTDKKIGFIAQDWENDFSAVISKDKNEKLGIKYTETIPVLLKAIQELKAEVEQLKTQINK